MTTRSFCRLIFRAFGFFIACAALSPQSYAVDVNNEIDPHHNNGNLTVSDEEHIRLANYSNYGVMTVSSTGLLHSEKEFFNIAQYDDVNGTYLASFMLDGGTFTARNFAGSSGIFHNYGVVEISRSALYENNSTFLSECDPSVPYDTEHKQYTLIDHATFNNYADGGEYKNLSGADTYVQNSATFSNAGLILNQGYFKVQTSSTLTNAGTFENVKTIKLLGRAVLYNTGTFTNSDSIAATSSARLYSEGASARFVQSKGELSLSDGAAFYNLTQSSFTATGGVVKLVDQAVFSNFGTVVFDQSAALHASLSSAGSSAMPSFQNGAAVEFKGDSQFSIAAGNHLNAEYATLSFGENATFVFSGGIFTNGGNLYFNDHARGTFSSGDFTTSTLFDIANTAQINVVENGYLFNCYTFKNAGTLSMTSGTFSNGRGASLQEQLYGDFQNTGTVLLSEKSAFENVDGAQVRGTGSFIIDGGRFSNASTFSQATLRLDAGCFENLSGGILSGTLSLAGGTFRQHVGAQFTNLGQTTLAANLIFYADRENLTSAIQNADGIIQTTADLKISLLLTEDFRDYALENVVLTLIDGNGTLAGDPALLSDCISLKWADGTSADEDFDWEATHANGNLAVRLNAYIPESAASCAFFAVLAFAFVLRRRHKG